MGINDFYMGSVEGISNIQEFIIYNNKSFVVEAA